MGVDRMTSQMLPRPDIVVPVCLKHTNEATCTLPWYVCESEYNPAEASYLPLVNGEETFRAVHLAIAEAKASVDIVCWGFQPSMYFIRDGQAERIGELLERKARSGVKVRVLGWEMPLNTAGFAGEANLPGKGWLRLWDRALQSATDEQYTFDRQWFRNYSVADADALALGDARIPLFVSRGFSWKERKQIAKEVARNSVDSQLSSMTEIMLRAAVTHHQKSVMVDYELPDRAVGFVMGHNMLDEYWDTDAHSGLNRDADSKPAPNKGARGFEPRQDISSQISGPILKDLHHNFATAWLKETGEDLLHLRAASTAGAKFECTPGSTRQIAQLLRTQAQVQATETQPQQAAVRDIERAYLQAVNNATQFIYIENQYFRWPPLADAIKATAANLASKGRDPALHGSLHLFVITNATKEGMGAGTVNTYRMLKSLGRADTIPGIAKLERVEEIRKNAPPKPRPDKLDFAGQREIAKWEEELDRQIKEVEGSEIEIQAIPGLKVHVCSLVATDTKPGLPWMPVYIHSKLMIIDDVFTTHGSANINTRSMMVDSELNIAHEWGSMTRDLRRRLWGMHAGEAGAQDDARVAFKEWERIIEINRLKKSNGETPGVSLIGFYFGEVYVRNWD